ncbi:MAG: hypothetical protein U5L45_04600 [Saprospiraceae bacterium]|nr:hypothetical protein [Saprospiraceae bacterium]
MKNHTLLTALFLGISLPLPAQKNTLPLICFFISYNVVALNQEATTDNKQGAASCTPKAVLPFFDDKTDNAFADLSDLGEDFWVEDLSFKNLSGNTSNVVGGRNTRPTTLKWTLLNEFKRFFGQEPRFRKK